MTDVTFGFDTALGIATEAIDRLHSTAHSHHRIIVCEIMGHRAGWLALGAGIAGGADVILIPEIPYDIDAVAEYLDLGVLLPVVDKFDYVYYSDSVLEVGNHFVLNTATMAPADLTAANYLALAGIPVTIYEALDEPGGMLVAGVPEYRLPRQVLKQEILQNPLLEEVDDLRVGDRGQGGGGARRAFGRARPDARRGGRPVGAPPGPPRGAKGPGAQSHHQVCPSNAQFDV